MMDAGLRAVCRFFEDWRDRGDMVLATILATQGSTYRKAGTRVLLAGNAASSGLISGGCLEGELREHARQVLEAKRARRVVFDTRNDDPLWGMGLGCEGAIEVWIEPVLAENAFGPVPYLEHCLAQQTSGLLLTVVGGEASSGELGCFAARDWSGGIPRARNELAAALGRRLELPSPGVPGLEWIELQGRRVEISVAPVDLPPRLLLCGAGRDAVPVQEFAAALGWGVRVYDHRPAYAVPASFHAATVFSAPVDELSARIDLSCIDAAVVMSHNLQADQSYLEQLLRSPVRHIGLLGPRARRERILGELGALSSRDLARLHAPVGLDIGAASPEGIAMSIVAQMHAALAGRTGGPFGVR